MGILYDNISNKEMPVLLRACYEENNSDMEKTAREMETIDLMLGVVKMKSLIDRRCRNKNSRWSRGHNFKNVLEAIILRK